ncbi:hypothetical protein TrVE_jg8809 [Triparma verrucosa]|uniref:Uncharacterized protein n=1 Tax=Triparma verrucosa TaxID=1606542 RepID=A0A9W7KS17_9STRA|nr:hypothetical protein TrVE_jg8809 [Triparma verrucosa]
MIAQDKHVPQHLLLPPLPPLPLSPLQISPLPNRNKTHSRSTFLTLAVCVLGLLNTTVEGFRLHSPWSTKQWCESVVEPQFPFAYSKYAGHIEETKGRTSTDLQDVRHVCEARGTQAKCHICEEIECGGGGGQTCAFQLQGVKYSEMSQNIPTVSDIPWAVGGSYRYDFSNPSTTHVCLHLSSRNCSSAFYKSNSDYSDCELRCWGYGQTGSDVTPSNHLEAAGYVPGEDYSGAVTVPWLDPKPTDVWEYQKSWPTEGPRNPNTNPTLTYNPQGYVYTHAGSASGVSGFVDGSSSIARFKNPEDVATDYEGYTYVADTGNHAIRMISPDGVVTTIAGDPARDGTAGSKDGDSSEALFSHPSGVAVWYDWQWSSKVNATDEDSLVWTNGGGNLALFVADTENHRIRKITGDVTYDPSTGVKTWSNVNVTCFAGRCGPGTSSFTLSEDPATPSAGYADGEPWESRFNRPRGIAVSDYGDVYVADTDNHLIRVLQRNGTARTLAGTVALAEEIGGQFYDGDGVPLQGCEPPCYYGVSGFSDGNLTDSKFHYPSDVAMGTNNTGINSKGTHVVYVTDKHRVRRIAFEVPTFDDWGKPEDIVSNMQGVRSTGRVSTIAGQMGEGERDGQGDVSSFNSPDGIIVTSDDIAYVVDSVSCRIRRITPAFDVADLASCSATVDSLIRPSGCASYDPPVDDTDLKATPSNGNTYNNYDMRNMSDYEFGEDYIGRMIKDCVGSPPPDALDKKFWTDVDPTTYPYNQNLVIDDYKVDIREDPNEGTTIKVRCPKLCSAEPVYGGPFYTTDSSVCSAAVHSGAITAADGGLITVTLQRGMKARDRANIDPTTANGITTQEIGRWADVHRLFTVEAYLLATVEVQTIAGAPAGLLENSCGMKDSMPPQEALFSVPTGISASINRTLSDSITLYVADRNNHNIRGMSATCSFVCENMGHCIGPDLCQCPAGWEGADCTRPTCSTLCGLDKLCVAPDTCACKPGFSGATCDTPLCMQTCENGGACSAPDTCTCANGWFDSNCTTPVCEQTCGNGGNCTSPDVCSCPSDWTGADCRIPVCSQSCQNDGFCVAPDTCSCPPQWSGHDCSLPVCHQGYFLPNPSLKEGSHLTKQTFWTEMKSCNISDWCKETDTFDCLQPDRLFQSVGIAYGPEYRHKTGKKAEQDRCFFIELGENIISPFPYINATDQAVQEYHRYSPKAPYDYLTIPREPHNNYISATDKFTQPWKYTMDRQIALVELLNVTQGVYVCANGGNCTAPDVCVCAPGWIGFDCRTPVCSQGYSVGSEFQAQYVRGTNLATDLAAFEQFMGNNTYRLDPSSLDGEGYSNPNYTMWWEGFLNDTHKVRYKVNHKGMPYLSSGNEKQGGYSCSVRSVTEWENENFLFEHPNYYSRYMDRKMQWPGPYYKSPKLEWGGGKLKDGQGTVQLNGVYSPDPVSVKTVNVDNKNVFYTYTDQGYRRDGDWTLTGEKWTKGTCIMEFKRKCTKGKTAVDLNNMLNVTANNLFVQDTDLAFRPRITYDDKKAYAFGRWFQDDGDCVDEVVRGCFNNGTCVAPDTCQCAEGWTGYDCKTPICSQTCKHNGNCTLPDTCTCEKGWEGHDCSVAVCAQECNNFGKCVAPDVCQCMQWPNNFYDGYEGGGRPIFRKPNGDPQMTGWTGYDCATPICVQAQKFTLNANISQGDSMLIELGGHGKDGRLECNDVRCHDYNMMVTQNDGKSFQTGCGYDPIDTGCCDTIFEGERSDLVKYVCHKCRASHLLKSPHNTTCVGMMIDSYEFIDDDLMEDDFKPDNDIKLCGRDHNPGGPLGVDADGNPTNNEYYVSYLANVGPEYSSSNGLSNFTSDGFLCNRFYWEQGDFIDDAGMNDIIGAGSDFGLQEGRHVRVNYPNYNKSDSVDENNNDIWMTGPVMPGEGIFECFNGGSCVGPDTCTCKDGWAGFDCSEPLCRHMQADSSIVGCLNGGICSDKDDCTCIQTVSVLWKIHKGTKRGMTGWTGTDCSMPVCVQGYYDPFCMDPNAPGGEGCYRCANGGSCTSPDYCECAEGWTGYDCKTPKCEVVTDFLTRKQLDTVDEEKVNYFETDPCTMREITVPRMDKGTEYYRGNCTLPNQCTCHCFWSYIPTMCFTSKENCTAPWQDVNMYLIRSALTPTQMFGSRDCVDGYEGVLDVKDRYTSCHMEVVVPSTFVRYTFDILVFGSLFSLVFSAAYIFIRRRMKRRYILAKIERRKSRRSSEESVTGADQNAFTY